MYLQLVACDIHKCASTSWMQAMWTMENIYTVDDFLHDRVIANRPLAGKKIRLFSVPNNEREEMWNNFDKVMESFIQMHREQLASRKLLD